MQAAECVLSPAMPSTTARAAGVFVPIINSLDERTRAFLTGQQLQGGNASSTLLLSAAAQNFLCVQLAAAQGVTFANPFAEWFVAASVPCVLSLLATPLVHYAIDPPELKDTPEAPKAVAARLELMGALSAAEARSSITLLPIRPRSRGERRSLRTFSPGASLRPHHGFNPDTPRRLLTPTDAFQLHPDVALNGPSTLIRREWSAASA